MLVNISFGSLLTGLLFGSVFMGIMVLILKKKQFVGKFHMNFLTVCLLLVLLRIAVPVQLKGATNVACTIILPQIMWFLRLPLGGTTATVGNVLLFVWVVVALGKCILFVYTQARFHRYIGSLERLEDRQMTELLRSICEEISLENSFTLIRIKACKSPFIVGIFHPVIVLPQVEFNALQSSFILRHEVGHYYQKDLWKKYLVEVACMIYWWNPLIFCVKRELDNVLELRRDAVITENLGEKEKIEYLECLLKVAKENNEFQNQKHALAFCKNFNRGSLEQRFYYILENQNSKKKYNSYLCWSVCMGALLLSFCFVFESYNIPVEDQGASFKMNHENSYILEEEGQYYLYMNNEKVGVVEKVDHFNEDIPVYTEEKGE